MIDPIVLTRSVLLLFLLVIPGYFLARLKLTDERAPKAFAGTIMYIAQPAMIIASFIRPYDSEILETATGVFAFSLAAHTIFLLIALLMFKKAPEQKKRVLRYGMIFANCGYMGTPLIMAILGAEAGIYASVFVIWFNIFSWSAGRMIFSGDIRYIKPKKMFLNPSVVAIGIGLVFFFLPLDAYVPVVITDALGMLRDAVAPLSMLMIGMRLAEARLKEALKDKYIPAGIFVRLLLFPALMWGILRGLQATGIYYNETVTVVTLVLSSTPSAAATGMFAEIFNGDGVYAGQFVAVTTLFSVATMPLISLLLRY